MRFRTEWSTFAALLTCSAAWLVTPSASACAVCGGDTPEESKMAFIVTTALLTFLPLGMMGAVFYWIRKRVRELEGGPRLAAVVDQPPAGPREPRE